ncbi:MAG: hypothetical protein MI807_05220 [Verrucomicrobiales bacterium]|nr:hypothetical protein [Verrucomicrobiales bacterium]
MKKLTYICSFLLIALGALGYFAWEALGASKQSITAAIPSFVGILMLLGALVAMKNHMAGMHIAVLFSLLGAVAGIGRIAMGIVKDGALDWGATSTLLILGMVVICGYYTIMAVRSFIAARRARD